MESDRALAIPPGTPVRVSLREEYGTHGGEVIEIGAAEEQPNHQGKKTVWLIGVNDDGDIVRVRARDARLYWGE